MSVNTAMVLPVMGRIAAGQPIEAVQNPETISLADFVVERSFCARSARRVHAGRGHSRRRLRACRKNENGPQRDIVVALVEMTDATLKRFYREGDKIRLQPSNAAMQPIIVPAASVEIQGRVIGVLRKY